MKKKAFGVVYALLTLFILGGCSTEDILGIKVKDTKTKAQAEFDAGENIEFEAK